MTTLAALPNSQDSDAPLASAARLLRAAVGLFGENAEPEYADMEHVSECIGVAVERLTTWLEDGCTDGDDRKPEIFDALDGCYAAGTLIEAGLRPRGLTASPIRGTLKLAADRLEDLLAADSDEAPAGHSAISTDQAEVAEAA